VASETDLIKSPKKKKAYIKRKSLLTKDVTSALDRSKVTDRQAVHLLAATAHALGHDVNSIARHHDQVGAQFNVSDPHTHRVETAADLKASFNPQGPLTVHWDGKLLPDLIGTEKVDRLPVIVTGTEIEHLLGVPKLASGTGQAQADIVITCLDDWNLREKVKGLCFDTTSSNTGHFNGACV